MNGEPQSISRPDSKRIGTTESLWTTMRSFPRPFWILIAGTFLNRLGTFVIPFMTLYLTGKGHTTGEVGWVLAAYGLGHLIASALGGFLADRMGRRNTIALSMFSTTVVMICLASANGILPILLFMFLAGLTAELYRPASSALLADLVPPEKRVIAFAGYRLAINAGWAFGPALGGLLTQYSFAWLFYGDALTSALFGIIAWQALPHGIHQSSETGGWRAALRATASNPQFLQIFFAAFAIGWVFVQMCSAFGLQVIDSGYNETTYGLLISLNGVIIVCCELPLAALVQRFPIRRMLTFGFGLIGLGFMVIGLIPTLPGFIAGVCIFTLGEMISMPLTAAYVANLAPVHSRGRYLGLFGTAWAISLVSGPGLGLGIYACSPTALWLGCGALGLSAAALMCYRPKLGVPVQREAPVGPAPVTQA